ncbi:MAG: hypoxanthine phosphoribosyltransferase [Myxococcota bacterium]
MSTIDVLYSAEAIAARIGELGQELSDHYRGERVVAVAVLKGSFVFLADLVRAMPEADVQVDFLGVSSYEGTSSTGQVRVTHDLGRSIAGAHVLLVEDIVDTGLTLKFLVEALEMRDPASLRVVSMLDKPSRRTVDIRPDWSGFVIPDHFVVGYGLDLDQSYRHLPFIGIYRG